MGVAMRVFIAILLLVVLRSNAQTLTWRVDPNFKDCETVIRSAIPTYSTKDKQDALVRLLRQFNIADLPPYWVSPNITNLCTVTASNFPPLTSWTQYAVVPPGVYSYKLNDSAPRRFFTATIRDGLGQESLFATK